MVDKKSIESLIQKHFVISPNSYHIDDQGIVHATKSVILAQHNKKLPVQFGEVKGNFILTNTGLKTLLGCPHTVGGNFDASNNNLVNLQGGPRKIGGDCLVSGNILLSTLDGCAQHVGGSFVCNHNKSLTSFEGCPTHVGYDFSGIGCGAKSLKGLPREIYRSLLVGFNQLESLRGAPETIAMNFNCSSNPLKSLLGGPKSVGEDYMVYGGDLSSLEGMAEHVGGELEVSNNPLTSLEHLPVGLKKLSLTYYSATPLLRLLEIPDVFLYSKGAPPQVLAILDKYAGTGKKGMLAAGVELTKAGYKENARW
jgi:hypothetical protein